MIRRRIVRAVDPGPVQSAYIIWDGSEVIAKGKVANGELLNEFIQPEPADQYRDDRFIPTHSVIEMIESFGMPVGKETFETCVWIGRFMQAWHGADRIYRKVVKLHMCGSVKAKDSNIRQALIDRLGAPGTKKNPGVTYGISGDCWQALALAVTWWDQYNVSRGAMERR